MINAIQQPSVKSEGLVRSIRLWAADRQIHSHGSPGSVVRRAKGKRRDEGRASVCQDSTEQQTPFLFLITCVGS